MKLNLWFQIERSDIKGMWSVHCLELDVISYGKTPVEALHMGFEAVSMVLESDLSRWMNPLRRRAPEEDWDNLFKIVNSKKHVRIETEVPPLDISQDDYKSIAVLVVASLQTEGSPFMPTVKSIFALLKTT